MILPKIAPCPSCHSREGPGILESIPLGNTKRHAYRVGCVCGWRGPAARSPIRAVDLWNEAAAERRSP